MFEIDLHDLNAVASLIVWVTVTVSILILVVRNSWPAYRINQSKSEIEPAPHLESMPIPDAAQCQNCGYSLRGLSEFRCPECGHPFNPRDSATIYPQRRLLGALRRCVKVLVDIACSKTLIWIILVIIATTLVAYMNLRRLRFWLHLELAIPSFLFGWVLWILIVIRIWHYARGYRSRAACFAIRMSGILLLAIPGSISVAWDFCHHGTFLFIGPQMITIVTSGFDCGNPHWTQTYWDDRLGLVASPNDRYESVSAASVLLAAVFALAAVILLRRRGELLGSRLGSTG